MTRERTIVVVTRSAKLSEPVMEYTINVAYRLSCRLLVAYVNTLPLIGNVLRNQNRQKEIDLNITEFSARAAKKGVRVAYVQESGRINQVIRRLCRLLKRVEFIVIDRNIDVEKASDSVSVPVFNVLSGNMPLQKKRRKQRSSNQHTTRGEYPPWKKRVLYRQTALYLTATAGLYILMALYGKDILQYWFRGSYFTVVPIGVGVLLLGVQIGLLRNLLRLCPPARKKVPHTPEILTAGTARNSIPATANRKRQQLQQFRVPD